MLSLLPFPLHFTGAAVLSVPVLMLPPCISSTINSIWTGLQGSDTAGEGEEGDSAQLVWSVQGETYIEQNASLTFAFS